ncbi:hypothetical protein EYF80_040116 [Liparis tanakae]|uniref:Uncharacterized protein n=1 Tax=Liparis tanakae TaxID=230148 RepID=A0A4Z2G7W4_9TELE|nr:hypothetical protein EYF80_040116 [Liparis tanakae]
MEVCIREDLRVDQQLNGSSFQLESRRPHELQKERRKRIAALGENPRTIRELQIKEALSAVRGSSSLRPQRRTNIMNY